MLRRSAPILLAVPLLALAACGKNEDVDLASYSCADFNKSLRTKGDDSAGRFINQLRDEAKLGQDDKTERREITLGVIYSCRGAEPSTAPADKAVRSAKQIKAGTFKAPGAPRKSKKKSTK